MPMRRQTATASNLRAISAELSHDNSEKNPLVETLRRQVANSFVVYANYKHAHWQTFGPLFRDLHLMFDEFAHEVLDTIDVLAERVRMIGPNPPSHLTKLAALASVKASADDNANMRQLIEDANKNALIVIKEMRAAAKLAEEHDDPGSVDLFSKTVQIYEKQEWWLRDILRKDDGLST
jgi:starvation-inducible DNA-binding protein